MVELRKRGYTVSLLDRRRVSFIHTKQQQPVNSKYTIIQERVHRISNQQLGNPSIAILYWYSNQNKETGDSINHRIS